jgi:hypothetical protein
LGRFNLPRGNTEEYAAAKGHSDQMPYIFSGLRNGIHVYSESAKTLSLSKPALLTKTDKKKKNERERERGKRCPMANS